MEMIICILATIKNPSTVLKISRFGRLNLMGDPPFFGDPIRRRIMIQFFSQPLPNLFVAQMALWVADGQPAIFADHFASNKLLRADGFGGAAHILGLHVALSAFIQHNVNPTITIENTF